MYNLTADSLWRAFSDVLNIAIDLYVPYVIDAPIKSNSLHGRRYPRHIKKLIARKRCIWRQLRIYPGNQILSEKYAAVSEECKLSIEKFELYIEKRVIETRNSDQFFKYINRKLDRSHETGVLKDRDGNCIVDDAGKADLLNAYYNSINIVDDGTHPTFSPRTASKLDDIHFDAYAIRNHCNKLKPKFSCGPDGYPPLLLKRIGPAIAEVIAHLFQSFMSIGRVPEEWKQAFIKPLYKKGPSADPASYRPVSLTSAFSKLMEKIIVEQLLKYLLTNNLISKHQHGFLSRRSTATNLSESLNDWTINMENKHSQSIAYRFRQSLRQCQSPEIDDET